LITDIIPYSSKAKKPASESVGMKAYNLWNMKKEGFRVPGFFVIPVSLVNRILFAVEDSIDEFLKTEHRLEALPQKTDGLVQKIRNIELPPEIMGDLLRAFDDLTQPGQFVAVRSSSPVEDGSKRSFAGQFRSVLMVNRERLISSVLDCIASAWEPGIFAYQQAHGLGLKKLDLAIIVQLLVESEKSGVGFSVDMSNNLADALIVAAYGYGEGVVADKSDTETYLINRQTKSVSIKKALKTNQVLTEKELLGVFDATLKAEALLGTYADIEFAFDNMGVLYILQMRPVTGVESDKLVVLDNTNIVESYPGLTLPLSFSFALDSYRKVFTNSAASFSLSPKLIENNQSAFSGLIELFNGRVYYRLDRWYQLVGLVYKSKKSVKAWEESVGLKDSLYKKTKSSYFGLIKLFLSSLWLLLIYPSRVSLFFVNFQKDYPGFRHFEKINSDKSLLWKHYVGYTDKLYAYWHFTIINDFLAFKVFGILQRLLRRVGFEQNSGLANDLILNTEHVDSESAILELLAMKKMILEDSDLSGIFHGSSDKILMYILSGKRPELKIRFENYLDKFGDRTLAELKLETPSLRQKPELLVKMIKAQLGTDLSLHNYRVNKNLVRKEAFTLLRNKLHFIDPRLLLIKVLVRWAGKGLANRENMRFSRTRAYGVVKELFLNIGKLMFKNGIIENENDVYYLQLEDLEVFCNGSDQLNYKDKVQLSKKAYQRFDNINLPGRIIYKEGVPPVFDRFQKLISGNGVFYGTGVSGGRVTAEAIVITEPDFDLKVSGKIIVSRMTDPGWVFLIAQSAGIISEKGSLLSHTAIVGRELRIPAIVGVDQATSSIQSGDIISMDGYSGVVNKIS